MGVTYNGQNYQGWQSQPSGLTIQDKLEAALAKFSAQSVSTICAGRTDAGVHGAMQVIHFDTDRDRTTHAWTRGTNANLPRDIAVQWAVFTSDAFHCRACATSRRYAYVLLDSPIRPSLETGRVGWTFRALDHSAMREAADLLIGEHDFTSFRASQCQALSPVKNMLEIALQKRGAYWRIEFEANAFLHHMIRNIMGCLVQVGAREHEPEWLTEVIEAKDRRAAAPPFAADGLYFLGPV
jgi:tRNA pseudouridine38-40 synthase